MKGAFGIANIVALRLPVQGAVNYFDWRSSKGGLTGDGGNFSVYMISCYILQRNPQIILCLRRRYRTERIAKFEIGRTHLWNRAYTKHELSTPSLRQLQLYEFVVQNGFVPNHTRKLECTGGYASFPALYAAQSMGIPTCVHESNAVPGVTTRLAANKASRVLVAFEESVRHYKHPEKVEVVGMPVRREFIFDTKEEARKELGLSGFVVVSAFGSQGAKVMNETIADMMPLEQADGFPFHHIHATGSFGKEWMPKRVMDNGVDWKNCPALDIREYIYDMPTVMAAADIVIGRAGSATCNEIGASGTPCILIPSPNVTNNHQEKNARVLEAAGGAVVVLEKDCTPQKLYELIRSLLADEDRRREMSRKLHTMVRLDSAERICDIVEQLTQSEK